MTVAEGEAEGAAEYSAALNEVIAGTWETVDGPAHAWFFWRMPDSAEVRQAIYRTFGPVSYPAALSRDPSTLVEWLPSAINTWAALNGFRPGERRLVWRIRPEIEQNPADGMWQVYCRIGFMPKVAVIVEEER